MGVPLLNKKDLWNVGAPVIEVSQSKASRLPVFIITVRSRAGARLNASGAELVHSLTCANRKGNGCLPHIPYSKCFTSALSIACFVFVFKES